VEAHSDRDGENRREVVWASRFDLKNPVSKPPLTERGGSRARRTPRRGCGLPALPLSRRLSSSCTCTDGGTRAAGRTPFLVHSLCELEPVTNLGPGMRPPGFAGRCG